MSSMRCGTSVHGVKEESARAWLGDWCTADPKRDRAQPRAALRGWGHSEDSAKTLKKDPSPCRSDARCFVVTREPQSRLSIRNGRRYHHAFHDDGQGEQRLRSGHHAEGRAPCRDGQIQRGTREGWRAPRCHGPATKLEGRADQL